MTCPKHAQIEEKLMVPPGSDWQPFTGWHPDYVYRIKPKPKVKKWRWVVEDTTGFLWVTHKYYSESVIGREGFVQKIDSTEIEVDE